MLQTGVSSGLRGMRREMVSSLGVLSGGAWCEQDWGCGWRALWVWSRTSFVVQPLSPVRLFLTPWAAAHQASLSFTSSWSLLKPMSIESVMPSNHLLICGPLLLLPSIFPSIRVFSNESFLHIGWPKYWSFSFSISPANENSRLISFQID